MTSNSLNKWQDIVIWSFWWLKIFFLMETSRKNNHNLISLINFSDKNSYFHYSFLYIRMWTKNNYCWPDKKKLKNMKFFSTPALIELNRKRSYSFHPHCTPNLPYGFLCCSGNLVVSPLDHQPLPSIFSVLCLHPWIWKTSCWQLSDSSQWIILCSKRIVPFSHESFLSKDKILHFEKAQVIITKRVGWDLENKNSVQ